MAQTPVRTDWLSTPMPQRTRAVLCTGVLPQRAVMQRAGLAPWPGCPRAKGDGQGRAAARAAATSRPSSITAMA
ncbi:hypothetical protein AcdelDRAFT_3692 [Acidovorax delafieldii 2AN]|uniref:Uncharacterized protein n=1 Tax=Acidovorax delafieldii 2AN TaxID=573060 RepID=C5T9W2_ACIDE|nr:hypothetical protein AcdelDRAFT_3692 [Acidovorax delafieldii 2AN]